MSRFFGHDDDGGFHVFSFRFAPPDPEPAMDPHGQAAHLCLASIANGGPCLACGAEWLRFPDDPPGQRTLDHAEWCDYAEIAHLIEA